jgi:hypothetical protein
MIDAGSPYIQSTSEGLGSPRTLEEIPLLISGGSEIRTYRKIAENVLHRFNQMLSIELRARYVFTQWDYTIDSSRDEELGHFADRSIEAVDNSEGVIAIVANVVTPTSRLEIRRVYELRRLGQDRQLWFLVVPLPEDHHDGGGTPLAAFVHEIKRDFEKERIYHLVEHELDFQASLIIEMMPFLILRTGSAFGQRGGARP